MVPVLNKCVAFPEQFHQSVLKLWTEVEAILNSTQPQRAGLEGEFILNYGKHGPRLQLSLLFLVAPLYWNEVAKSSENSPRAVALMTFVANHSWVYKPDSVRLFYQRKPIPLAINSRYAQSISDRLTRLWTSLQGCQSPTERAKALVEEMRKPTPAGHLSLNDDVLRNVIRCFFGTDSINTKRELIADLEGSSIFRGGLLTFLVRNSAEFMGSEYQTLALTIVRLALWEARFTKAWRDPHLDPAGRLQLVRHWQKSIKGLIDEKAFGLSLHMDAFKEVSVGTDLLDAVDAQLGRLATELPDLRALIWLDICGELASTFGLNLAHLPFIGSYAETPKPLFDARYFSLLPPPLRLLLILNARPLDDHSRCDLVKTFLPEDLGTDVEPDSPRLRYPSLHSDLSPEEFRLRLTAIRDLMPPEQASAPGVRGRRLQFPEFYTLETMTLLGNCDSVTKAFNSVCQTQASSSDLVEGVRNTASELATLVETDVTRATQYLACELNVCLQNAYYAALRDRALVDDLSEADILWMSEFEKSGDARVADWLGLSEHTLSVIARHTRSALTDLGSRDEVLYLRTLLVFSSVPMAEIPPLNAEASLSR